MQDELLDIRSLLPNPLTYLGEFLTNLTENSHFSALVKDVKTTKALMSNTIASNKWGLTPQEMQGKTTRELYERVDNFKNREDVLKKLQLSEKEALHSGQSS
jgi:hypothetical protein